MIASRSGAAWRLANAQHGVLSRSDLLGLGFSDKGIKHRIASGRLHPIATGIYAVGRPELTPKGRWMAAVLTCGDDAFLSHRSAAELWGFGYEQGERIDVTVLRRTTSRRKGLRLHCRPSLTDQSFVQRFNIPVTHPVQTLIDIATELQPLRLERAVNEADKLGLVDPETLRAKLDDHPGEPGVKTLRTMLGRHTFVLSDSELETLFRPIARAAALPSPSSKHWLLGYEVDFYFPSLDLVVETDGLRYHRTPSQQARMAKRDQTHTAAGFAVLRFTHWQIAFAPSEVTEVLQRFQRSRARPQLTER